MKKDIWTRKRYPKLKKCWGIFKKIVNLSMWAIFIFLAILAVLSEEMILIISAPSWLAITLFIFPVFKNKPEDVYDQIL